MRVNIKDVPEIKTLRGRNTLSRVLAENMTPPDLYDWLRWLIARDMAHKLEDYIDIRLHLDEDKQEIVIESSLSICKPDMGKWITIEDEVKFI